MFNFSTCKIVYVGQSWLQLYAITTNLLAGYQNIPTVLSATRYIYINKLHMLVHELIFTHFSSVGDSIVLWAMIFLLIGIVCSCLHFVGRLVYYFPPACITDWGYLFFVKPINIYVCIYMLLYIWFIGKHVRMGCPMFGGSMYYNYKSFHLTVLMKPYPHKGLAMPQ